MKRLFFIVEGGTEERFVSEVLAPYLQLFQIYDVRPTQIQTSPGHKGGFVNYEHMERDVQRILKSEKEIVVTTFVDFFRLPKRNFPNWGDCFGKNGSDAQIECLESAISVQINDQRFIPYIQKHEFEALLFSSNKGFETYFDAEVAYKTAEIVANFDNPEEINSSPNGAPSKRIETIMPAYQKVDDGNIIALEIGIETILQKCPRFAAWVQKLIDKTKSNTTI